MSKRNNPQWDNGYPQLELIKEDIEKQRLYVSGLKENENNLLAMAVIDIEKDSLYETYSFWSKKNYLSIHRVISMYSGLGRFMIDFGIEKSKKLNKKCSNRYS